MTAAAATPPIGPASWTQFRLNNQNNAVVSATLDVSWRTHTGAPFSSSPTVANGVLYIGDNGGALYALDPETGKIRWTARVAEPLMSAPLVYGGLVIVGEGNENSPGSASPAHPIHVGGGASALLAFDTRNGALRWRIPLPGSGMPTGAIIDGMLVHHNGAGSVYGVDPATGRVLYKRDLHSIASMTAALPLGSGKFATLGVDKNALWILDAKTGNVVSSTAFSPIASAFGDCPPVSNGAWLFCNYVMPPSSAVPVQTERAAVERAFLIDLRAGKRLWDIRLESGPLPRRNEAAIPLYAYGTIFCGSSVAPYVHAIDPATGAFRWRTQTRGPVLSGMAAVGGVLYFGDLGGYLWAIDARTGNVIGDIDEGTPFNVGSPLVIGNTLVIGSRGGTIVAVPLDRIRESRD